jgi:hypothetical protein
LSDFERIEQIERHPSIELSDEMIKSRWINLHNKPPLIPMNIEAALLEKQVKEKGMHPKKNKRTKCKE